METLCTSAKPLRIWEAVIRHNNVTKQTAFETALGILKDKTRVVSYLVLLYFTHKRSETGEGRDSIAVCTTFEEILPYCEKYVLAEDEIRTIWIQKLSCVTCNSNINTNSFFK